jgi:hypothetical protein
VARLVDPRPELVWRGGRKRVRPERGDRLVVGQLLAAKQLRPGALLSAELPQPELAAVGDAEEDARASVP